MDAWQENPAGDEAAPPGEPRFPPGPPPARGPRSARGITWAAWVVIVSLIGLKLFLLPMVASTDEATGGDDPVGELLMGIQGRYLVGAADIMKSGELLYAQSGQFNVGSVSQRLRFVVLAAELSGPVAARAKLDLLRQDVEAATQKAEAGETRFELRDEDAAILRMLDVLYPPVEDGAEAAVDAGVLDDHDRALFVGRLGWFGELALAPGGASDGGARAAVLGAARRTFGLVIGVFVAGGVVGVGGFAGLVALTIMIVLRKLRSGIEPGRSHHGIYAETFAVWMVVFLLLQMAAGRVGLAAPAAEMPCVIAAFFLSLGVLVWPTLRGVAWSQVREDIGWTKGRKPALEPVIGVGCYAMALPLLAVGVLGTFICLGIDAAIDAVIGGDPVPFAPANGPAHPIVAELGTGSVWKVAQILFLGSVAAPIVEETMFRGVLYRHLRDATRGAGRVLSVVLSAALSALVFAIIHPQGWVAVPALMALAVSFSLAREWRGTLIPCMIVHGISNGVVLGIVSVLARA